MTLRFLWLDSREAAGDLLWTLRSSTEPPYEARTAPDGTVTVERRAWTVTSAPDSGYRALNPEVGRLDVDSMDQSIIWVARCEPIAVRVHDVRGRPVAGARVVWTTKGSNGHSYDWMGQEVSDSTGIARFADLPRVEITLAVSAPGYRHALLRRPPVDDGFVVTLHAVRTSLFVHAMDATDGSGIGAGVTFSTVAGQFQAKPAPGSVWQLDEAPPAGRDAWLRVHHDDYLATVVYVHHLPDGLGTADQPVRIPLVRSATVTVRHPDGARIRSATATVEPHPVLDGHDGLFVDTPWFDCRATPDEATFDAPLRTDFTYVATTADRKVLVARGRVEEGDVTAECRESPSDLEILARSIDGHPIEAFHALVTYGAGGKRLPPLSIRASAPTPGVARAHASEHIAYIRIRAPGFQESLLIPDPSQTRRGSVEATLYPTHDVRIRVVDTKGDPVIGTLVGAYPSDSRDIVSNPLGSDLFATRHDGWQQQRRPRVHAYTDAEGIAKLRLADGTWRCSAYSSPLSQAGAEANALSRQTSGTIVVDRDSTHELVVAHVRRVAISVRDRLDGAPLPNARITIEHTASPPLSGTLDGADGILALEDDAFLIHIALEGYRSTSMEVLARDRFDVAMTEDGAASVRFEIANAAGRPVMSAPVQIAARDGPTGSSPLLWFRHAVLEDLGEGVFQIDLPVAEATWIHLSSERPGVEFTPLENLWTPGATLKFRLTTD